MMKIAYYFSSFPLVSTTFIQREIYELKRRGIEIVFFANKRPKQGEFHASDRALLESTRYLAEVPFSVVISAHFTALFKTPGNYFQAFFEALFHAPVFANIKHWLAAPVVVQMCQKTPVSRLHVHFAFGAASVACFASRLSGIPYSISIHGSDVLLPDRFLPFKLQRACLIISNCQYHVDFLKKKYPCLQTVPFTIVRIGLDCLSARWQPAAFPMPLRPLRLLCVGRLVPVKAHWILIEAIALAGTMKCAIECRIIGNGPLKTALEKKIQEASLCETIQLLGSCNETEVAANIEWAHVVVLSSLSEGTPMTLIEAMAKGRPTIAPDITAIPEMVRANQTGLLFPRGSPSGMAMAIKQMYEESEKLEQMGNNGRRYVELFHDIGKNGAVLAKLFRASR